MPPLLHIQNLTVLYRHGKTWSPALRDFTLVVEEGKTVGLVGESGCGKSTAALAVMGLLPRDESRISNGQILLHEESLLKQSPTEWQQLRGKKVAMVFQDPFSSLNPVLKIAAQLEEILRLDRNKIHKDALVELLNMVHLEEAEGILKSYPHQLSGGQRQRILIAMALARRPTLFIADEPTTALDVTIQDQIMKLLRELQNKFQMTMLFITHNIGLVKGFTDTLGVMYAGELVETGPTPEVLGAPHHPYTQNLLKCIPRLTPQSPLPSLKGQPPEPYRLPTGCPFHPRCEKVFAPCDRVNPPMGKVGNNSVRCHLYGS